LYKSTNGGSSFSLIHSFESTEGYWRDIHFIDNNNGYVCRGNKIYKTSDAGSSWTAVVTLSDGELVELHFTDAHMAGRVVVKELCLYLMIKKINIVCGWR
jgi:photosystem II stability/assembly factor-like uncharacterized protein